MKALGLSLSLSTFAVLIACASADQRPSGGLRKLMFGVSLVVEDTTDTTHSHTTDDTTGDTTTIEAEDEDAPSGVPSLLPTGQPTALPTGQPSPIPTMLPLSVPTPQPTAIPTPQKDCDVPQSELDWTSDSLWGDGSTYSCQDMEDEWGVCTNDDDTNHDYLMLNCPVTCSIARGEECPTGEAVCEGHDFTEDECLAVGCCHWNTEVLGEDNNCWSSVGTEACSGNDDDEGGDYAKWSCDNNQWYFNGFEEANCSGSASYQYTIEDIGMGDAVDGCLGNNGTSFTFTQGSDGNCYMYFYYANATTDCTGEFVTYALDQCYSIDGPPVEA
mmetsp:Transcript_6991/g.16807  ORF Transcript_6991/g.16807 Transcript_6991/m.16807 type:complete len:329 (-) Transcript_6991:58-1044(-)